MVISIDKINVILLMKNCFFRNGVEQVMISSDGIKLSQITDINDVPYMSSSLNNCVAIIDFDLPFDGGFTVSRQIKLRLPDIGIIALTANYDDVQLFQVLKAQASACLRKDCSPEELLDAVRRVARGQHPINESLVTRPFLADQVFRQFQQLSRERDSKVVITHLTTRESEILFWMSNGLMNKQIAVELSISEQTIKNHITAILRKMNVNSRSEAVALAKKQGLIGDAPRSW